MAADICQSQGRTRPEITSEALEELKNVRWTGNIRELRNVIERLAILCDDRVEAEDIRQSLQYAAWLADETIQVLEMTSA